ncbi:MAG: tRNA uridine-5-carboxymethylaminomethyl(34) synthesis GTPase MnmE [Rhodospirillales bacterium]|jgi:tRNA modification GTPase|nr:tRNA uridine-5-carboxymethylaminomethyl(34) synthesis GTPase MnmE [Rhodospirillales bacterium]
MRSDTIFAVASAAGLGASAMVRVSGPGARDALRRISGRGVAAPQRLSLATLTDPETEEIVDRGLVAWFPGPRSFTGEDVAEFHVHGGRAVMAGLIDALSKVSGLRVAEAGEFTRRAFENGKMDLTEAEGLADLVAAETAAQRRQALRQMEGALGRVIEDWRRRLLGALAHLEATIDFSDEDLPAGLDHEVRSEAAALAREVASHLNDDRRGERLRDGVTIAVVGAPNAGKSSLVNHLAQRDAAIVSASAGTTRDVVEVHLDLGGYPVVVADTAGLRDDAPAGDGGHADVEREGIRRARKRAEEADVKLAVFDGCRWPSVDCHTTALVDANTIVVINKSDLGAPAPPLAVNGNAAHPVSALTGAGIDALVDALTGAVAGRCTGSAAPPLTRARHRSALQNCHESLDRALLAPSPELCAEDLRLAVRALGRIAGRVDVEEVLDVIFAEFCIGK